LCGSFFAGLGVRGSSQISPGEISNPVRLWFWDIPSEGDFGTAEIGGHSYRKSPDVVPSLICEVEAGF
jgi:hypothetical protein